MFRGLCVLCLGCQFLACSAAGPGAALRPEPSQVTDDPTGLFPESPTLNGRPDVHRAFILEKGDFLLGEPIVVELRTWPRGGEAVIQHFGGSDRMFGRNNNFVFLLQDKNGEWVGGPQSGSDHGGLISGVEATSDKPVRVFQAVQRWCAIEKPGIYNLFCFYHEPVVSERTLGDSMPGLGPNDRPLDSYFPIEVREWLKGTRDFSFEDLMDTVPPHAVEKEYLVWDARWKTRRGVESAHDFAQFTIEIRDGTASEREDMVAAWLKRTEREQALELVAATMNQAEATLEAIYFSRQKCWLPTMKNWCGGGRVSISNGMYVGLLLNPQVDATRIALNCPDQLLSYWDSWPQPGLLERLAVIAEEEGDSELGARAKVWRERLAADTGLSSVTP